jgi:hypothetical protein
MGEVYVLGTSAGIRNDTRRQVNCSDGGGGGGWCLFSLSLLPGPMIWLYGFSWDEKAEMCRLCIEQKFPFCADLFEFTCALWSVC